MTVRIHASPIAIAFTGGWFGRRWFWYACATRGGELLDQAGGFTRTRLGATIARDRAADRLRRTHGGGT